LAVGTAEKRERAFVVSMVPVLKSLFGSPHVRTLTTLTRVALDCDIPEVSVRRWVRELDLRPGV
jgi:hypothetical protein